MLVIDADHLGGTNVITTDTGVKRELVEYTPFGSIAKKELYGSNPQVAEYYFTGKPLDDETGLYYYGARYYDPSLGRFITPDPIVAYPGNPQNLNRYSYVHNNPVNLVDPTGNFAFLAALAFIAKAAVVGATIGAVVGGVVGGISAAVTGANVLQGIGSGMLSGAISGAAGGAAFGVGAVGLTILGGPTAVTTLAAKVGLGAFAGAASGAAGSAYLGTDVGQGTMFGAAIGLVTAGVANTSFGQKIGEGLNKVFQKIKVDGFLTKLNNWVTNSYNDFLNATYAGKTVSNVPITFKDAEEVWHATNNDGIKAISASKAVKETTYVFNPSEKVNGVRLGKLVDQGRFDELRSALHITNKELNTVIRFDRSSVILAPAPNGPFTSGGASQAIIYGHFKGPIPVNGRIINTEVIIGK